MPAKKTTTRKRVKTNPGSEGSNLGFTLIAEISMKKIGCNPAAAKKADSPVFLCRVWGESVLIKPKENRSGDAYNVLIGKFRVETAERKQYESGRCLLPSGLMDSIEATMKTSDGNAVQFAFDIFAEKSEAASIGYQYAVKPLIETEPDDRLAKIGQAIAGKRFPGGD